MVPEPGGATLLIRVWFEADLDGFRARLTGLPTDPGGPGGEVTIAVVSSVSEVLDAVRAWLHRTVPLP